MGFLKIKVNINDWGLETELVTRAEKVQHVLAEKIKQDTERYVPWLSGSLTNRTQVVNNQIIYPGPYAQYLYYGKVMVNAATGKGPAHYVDKNGNEVIRFPYGSKLRATSKNLVFTTSHHPDAQAEWFEASKAQNLDKWKRVAGRVLTNGTNKR